MSEFADLMDETDPLRWVWWGKAAHFGGCASFLYNFWKVVRDFKSGSGSAQCVFQIGQALNGCVDEEEREIFGEEDDFDNLIGPANDAIGFYKSQLAACRRAVDTWTLVGSAFVSKL